MMTMPVRELLRDELRRRQTRNRRYSLRAFARDVGVHHSTLSRVLRGRQRVTAATLMTVAVRLRLAPEVVRESERDEADAAVRACVSRREFRPDARWIATVTGLSLDAVHAALHRLLRDRVLRMDAHDRWTITRSEAS